MSLLSLVRSCLERWENIWRKVGDVDVWNFGGTVRQLSKKFWHFRLKGLAVADSDWDVDDWKIFLTEGRFDLGKEDGVGDMIKDDCGKHDDDNCDDNCYDNTSCNVFFIRVFFHRHWRFTGQQGKGGDHLLLHSTTLPAHEHWDIYLQLCMMLVYLMSWF